jgi:hypothetical protein
LLFIRAIRAICGFNSGFRVYAAKLLNRRQKSQKTQNKLVSSFPLSGWPTGSRPKPGSDANCANCHELKAKAWPPKSTKSAAGKPR